MGLRRTAAYGLLIIFAALIVAGFAMVWPPLGFIVAGVLGLAALLAPNEVLP